MKTFIAQAKRCLPQDAPLGTLLTVPVQKQTGNIPLSVIDCDNNEYDIYKFLRSRGKWIYLGKSEIRENQKHLFRSLDWSLRNNIS